MIRILLVEDEKAVRELTKVKLGGKYEIVESTDGEDALDKLMDFTPELMIVDIMMPRMNGFDFVRELRENGDTTPVIMLTAMDDFSHKKKGYNLGIDEYLTKPIDYEELSWHIEAILRRSKISSDREIVIGDLKVSEESMSAVYGDKRIDLSEREFKILFKLLSYPDVIFTKQQIMDDIWGFDSEADYNSIKTYMSRIRTKFEDCREFELVSVRGVGYKAVIHAIDQ